MTASEALAAALDMELIIDISQVNDGTGLCRVNLVEKHKELIREAVRAAVEEERANGHRERKNRIWLVSVLRKLLKEYDEAGIQWTSIAADNAIDEARKALEEIQ